MIHFQYFLRKVWGVGRDSFFCQWIANYSRTIYWKGYASFIEMLLLFSQILLGLFLWFYFWALYSIPFIYVSFLQYITILITVAVYFSSKISKIN